MHPVLPLLVDQPVVLVLGLQAAARGAEHHPGALGQRLGDLEPRLGHRLAGGEERELGEGVVERQLLPAEVLLRAVAADLPADGDREPLDVREIERRRCRERPSRIAAMVSPAVRPSALTAPWPVMTTRAPATLLLGRDQVLHGPHDGVDGGDVELGLRSARWR